MIQGGAKARYFNGLNAIPAIGDVHYYSGQIRFLGEYETGDLIDVRYPIASRISMERDPSGRGRVRFPHDENKSLEIVIVIEDTEFYNLLVDSVKHEKGDVLKRLHLIIMEAGFRAKITLALIAGVFVIGGFIYSINHLYKFIPESADKRVGKIGYTTYIDQYTLCENRLLNSTIRTMLNQLNPENSQYQYVFSVVNDEDPNAFAFPGGYIIINSGLLRESESQKEVAGVLAHEIAHVEQRHGIRQLVRMMGIAYMTSLVLGSGLEGLEGVELAETSSEIASTLLILKYSRDFEQEADDYATVLLKSKGLDVSGLIQFFEKILEMEKEMKLSGSAIMTYINTHPDTAERIIRLKENEKAAKETDRKARSVYFAADWEKIKTACE